MTRPASFRSALRRSAAGLAVALALAGAALTVSSPAEARWQSGYGWGIAGAAAGVLALGAIAEANRAPTYSVEEPPAECYQVRRKIWTGTSWRVVRRTVCE